MIIWNNVIRCIEVYFWPVYHHQANVAPNPRATKIISSKYPATEMTSCVLPEYVLPEYMAGIFRGQYPPMPAILAAWPSKSMNMINPSGDITPLAGIRSPDV